MKTLVGIALCFLMGSIFVAIVPNSLELPFFIIYLIACHFMWKGLDKAWK